MFCCPCDAPRTVGKETPLGRVTRMMMGCARALCLVKKKKRSNFGCLNNKKVIICQQSRLIIDRAGHCDTVVTTCSCPEVTHPPPAAAAPPLPHTSVTATPLRRVVNKGRHVVQWSTWSSIWGVAF